MTIHPLAGQLAPADLVIDVGKLQQAYYEHHPDPSDPVQLISFGTSGHRGSPASGTFTEAHILAVTQAICDYRRMRRIDGPLYLGKDTHAASGPAHRTALEVLAANQVPTFIECHDGPTPTPVISRAILVHNLSPQGGRADGIVITPSHNPPSDGGIKYNPPSGGPADIDVTDWIENRANDLLRAGNGDIKRVAYPSAIKAPTTHHHDYVPEYVNDLPSVVDLAAIRSAGLKLGVDPLGGASVNYWQPIQETFKLDISVVNASVDPTFSFMTLDHDGKIRMDCSSRFAMARLLGLKDQFHVAFGNDPDADRHGIVTPSAGLMNPNHFLAVAIRYLLTHRDGWPRRAAIGKTLVSSQLIDRVAKELGRPLVEVPVGFKWFTEGLLEGSYCFAGEESAGASFLRKDGSVWTTDKDGLILGLVAAEITARTGRDPGEHFQLIAAQHGTPYYARIDAPATPAEKAALARLNPDAVAVRELAGEPIVATLTCAPGNRAPIGGLKVATENGWFAVRPSGTENIYKIYAESFRSQNHLDAIVEQAQRIVSQTLAPAGR